MTNVTTINATEIARRRGALELALKERTGGLIQREELEIEQLADPIDQIRSNTDREIAVLQLDGRTRQIREIRSAMERIEDGVYGSCERCEEPIGKRRLDALPWARLCVNCQAQQESEASSTPSVFDTAA
jgi:DnaK suppressor protein